MSKSKQMRLSENAEVAKPDNAAPD